jgi:hypothetical protein|tara:strand:- start:1252 stop:1923 length:672 start_codon:yes stop_codon:yes gene_type:complete
MDFQDLVDTPQKVKTLAGTLVFLVAFPIYFEALPSLIDGDSSGGGSSGLSGSLLVSFEESTTSLSESVSLNDGESHDSFFDVIVETELSIGFVELQVSCFDNDDPGPGFTDSVDGISDLSDVEGIDDQSADGDCSGGGNGGFTIRWDVTADYTGDEFTEEEMDENEIREMWNDGENGRGVWIATITATIEAAPIAGGLIDSDEDFEITWTVVFYELIIEAASG